jgi:hypothetical protein
MTTNSGPNDSMLGQALDHLRSAIALLDLADAPEHIAAHVDLAVNQLENLLPSSRTASKAASSEMRPASGPSQSL